MKRTLKRECKGLEIAKREAAAGSMGCSSRSGLCQHQLAARDFRSGEVHRPCFTAGVRFFNPGQRAVPPTEV